VSATVVATVVVQPDMRNKHINAKYASKMPSHVNNLVTIFLLMFENRRMNIIHFEGVASSAQALHVLGEDQQGLD